MKKFQITTLNKLFIHGLLLVAIILSLNVIKTPRAFACECLACSIDVGGCSAACICQSNIEKIFTLQHIIDEFTEHQRWLVETVFQDHVLPSMMMMTEQLSAISLQQTQIIGTFFDAKHQLETQRLLQDLQAQAHKAYQPSVGMCRFGTTTRSLAAADSNVNFNMIAMAARNTQRQLLAVGAIGTGSARDDSRSRLDQFKNRYCNPADFGFANDLLCVNGNAARMNKDVNYTHTIQGEDTLNIDFSNAGVTDEEEDVLALSTNLYGNVLFPKIPEVHMANIAGSLVESGAGLYMDSRALTAKRSVAFNSYAAQTAMRSQGGEAVVPYISDILKEMGVSDDNIAVMLKGKPSYNMQMELLSKKLYQSANFFSDLYDTPVNIERKDVAMMAIGLMQQRDMYRSQLRSEANTAIWLETEIERLQEDETNEANPLSEGSELILDTGL